MSNRVLIDAECYTNFFMLGLKDYYTGETSYFEISEWRDDRVELGEWLKNYKEFVIGFNTIHYDNMVLAFIKRSLYSWRDTPVKYINSEIKRFSDKVIDSDNNWEELKAYKYEFSRQWTDVDLFLYWAKMLRLSKKISLKGLGIQLGYPVVMELPYNPSHLLTQKESEEIKEYNLVHDLGILKLLSERMKKDIKQREDAKNKYGFKCYSWDGVKLGQNILIKSYCDKYNKDPEPIWGLRGTFNPVKLGDIILDKISFDKTLVNYRYKTIKKKQVIYPNSFYSLLEHLKNRTVNTTDELSYSVIRDEVKYDIKSGGLHSWHSNNIIQPDLTKFIYRDEDVSSYYPSLGCEYEFIPAHLPGLGKLLKEQKTERVKDKREGRLADAELKKLALNGGFYGNLNNNYSPLYDPSKLLSITLNGQLFILMLCEAWINAGITVDMVNTDGATAIIPKDKESQFKEICKWWEELTLMELEAVDYIKVIRANINNYMAISTSGKIKKKGLFVTEPDLGNSVDFLVIPKCLELYFTKGIRPEIILKEPEKYGLHIYDFCCAQKVDKTYSVEWMNKRQQRLNRFYVSTKGGYLYKCRTGSKEHILKDWGVTIYNSHEEKPFKDYKLDEKFYLSKINTIISELESNHQLKMF